MSSCNETPSREHKIAQPETFGDRVCDKCMVKKRRCNRQRPTCSRCAEDDALCVYSFAKRKPGPAKGFRRRSTHVPALSNSERLNQLPLPTECLSTSSSADPTPLLNGFPSLSPFAEIYPTTAISPDYTISTSNTNSTNNTSPPPTSIIQTLQQDQVDELLRCFFSSINLSLRLFDQQTFLGKYQQGLINEELLVAILAVASHVQTFSTFGSSPILNGCLDKLLATSDIDDQDATITLNKFQEACLLSFFEFHQYPGRKAWLRVGRLTRKAYEYDLHQIDSKDQCQLYHTSITPSEIEEWRRLWWAIYCLDSYCNIVSFTPFIIERESLKTALLPQNHKAAQLFLPADTESLWKTVKMIAFGQANSHANVHIVTTTMLRELGKTSRIWRQHQSSSAENAFSVLDDHLSTIRLALPPRYLDASRNVHVNESQSDHHARLICVLHLNACRLLLSIPRFSDMDELRWHHSWQVSLEYCEDIALVVKHWRAEQCASVDPAICFIISATLMLLHLHYMDKANSASQDLRAKIRSQMELLQLLLEQFSSIWHLARFLIVSFQKFAEILSDPLKPQGIARIIGMIPSQLHHSWLKFLSLHPDNLKPPVLQEFDPNLFSEVDLFEWDTWANIPTI